MKDLLVFITLLSLLGVGLFLQWALRKNIISVNVNWVSLREKMFENLVFSVIMTALLGWIQIFLMLLLK
ncbi:hypothetical protein [Gottfriedia acidiceleris]|uniref:hypothetical protein n=1 Tax=Gottfriedia acidiceleris TaxID=371036 RepID=UPI002FFFD4A9